MGEVYLAEDTKLGRQVALKVLPADLTADATRRERFEREARAVAALNHPSIVTLHSIDQVDETPFLTMEFVDGQAARELIPQRSAARSAARRSRFRSPTPSAPHTSGASSTATSSPPTSWSPATAV